MPFATQQRLDVVFEGVVGGRPLATDVSLVQPYATVGEFSAVEHAANTKVGEYGALCQRLHYQFQPGVVDMFGNMCKGLRVVIATLARAMSTSGVCDYRAAVAICFGQFNIAVARGVGGLLAHNKAPV
jgi:hypothetical protein